MNARCTCCGRTGAAEGHHVAGRANHPTAVITACLDCHRRYLTPWQRCSSIPLGGADSSTQRSWALAVGALHVLGVAAHRYGLPDAAAAVLWVERAALRMFPDDAPDPSPAHRPCPSADGTDPAATARALAGIAPWFTDDPDVIGWLARLADGVADQHDTDGP